MRASLSVRIGEHPRRKDATAVPFERLAALAARAGFEGVSLRASVVSVSSDAAAIARVRHTLERHALQVSMVTGDLPLATNDSAAPGCLRNFAPYVTLADALGACLLRVMLHSEADIALCRAAADVAALHGIGLAQQCHWGSLCESAEDGVALVQAVDRNNFGVTFEPANLLACGADYGERALARLGPALFNVYFQNLCLDPKSPVEFATRRRGRVGVRFVPLDEPSALDAVSMVAALRKLGYSGWFTVHQPLLEGERVEEAIERAGAFVRDLGVT